MLRLSRDGSRLLVASSADSTYYVVDAINGVVERSLPAVYYTTGGRTGFTTDADLKYLWSMGPDSTRVGNQARLIDMETGEILYDFDDFRGVHDISSVHNRIGEAGGLYELDTYELLWAFEGVGSVAWFDDDRAVFYRYSDYLLTEHSTETGEPLRAIGTKTRRGRVRRPKNSDWLYVFASGEQNGPNFVEAIHIETSERVFVYQIL